MGEVVERFDSDRRIKTIETVKRRWLRKLDFDSERIREVALGGDEKPLDASERLPTLGCHVELTRVTLSSAEIWWTVGFEAFGPLTHVERILQRTLATCQKSVPDFGNASRCSYPAWLAELAPGRPQP